MSQHWATRYLGRPWVDDGYDCADLVADVVADRTGRRIALPGRAAGLRGRDRQLGVGIEAVLEETTAPADGDVALMRLAGRRAEVGYHVGVYCDTTAGPAVLHCLVGLGACLHLVETLPARGYTVTGYFRLRDSWDAP